MTPNQVSVHSDGICIYLTIKVRNALLPRLFLLLINLLMITAVAAAIFYWLPLLFFIATVTEVFVARYTMWNFFGSELIMFNTKAMTYQHDYGFFKTKVVTSTIGKVLHCKAIATVREKNAILQYLEFGSYDENDLPYVLYQAALPVQERDTRLILQLMDKLHVSKLAEEQVLSVVHLN